MVDSLPNLFGGAIVQYRDPVCDADHTAREVGIGRGSEQEDEN